MAHVADLADYFLEAVDQAAIASADWRGKGGQKCCRCCSSRGYEKRPLIKSHLMDVLQLAKVKEMKHQCYSLEKLLVVKLATPMYHM